MTRCDRLAEGGDNLTITGNYLLGDRSPHPDQDLADRLDDPVWDCACSLTGATGRVWQLYMVPGSQPPLLDVAEALTITPPGAGATGEDEFTFRDAQIGWYPADPEPESAGGLVSDIYTLAAFGVSVLLRRRSASTCLHLDTEASLTKPLLGPLEVEVNNGGETAYDCGQPTD